MFFLVQIMNDNKMDSFNWLQDNGFLIVITFLVVIYFLFVYLKRSNVANKGLVGIVSALAVIILAAVYFAPSVVNDIEPIIDVKTQPERVAENLVSAMYQESNGNKAIECMSDIVFNLQGRSDSERIEESRNAFIAENNNNYKWIGDDKYVIKGVGSTRLVGYERDEYIQNVFNYFYHIDARNLYDIYAGNIGEVALCTVNVLHIDSDGTENEEKLSMYCWQEYGEWVVVELD